jgi:uncharacterized protein
MRLVIDTNLLVSAFVFGGNVKRHLAQILVHERIYILTSTAAIQELKEVLSRKEFQKFQKKTVLTAQLSAFLADAITIGITHSFSDCRDAKDNKFLDLAVSGQADVLITGDNDLLELHPFHGVSIVTLTDFIQLYLPHFTHKH